MAPTEPEAGSSRPLRLALVAPPWYEVPPDGYGGIEQIVGDLANGLARRGHDVTLVAAGDDRTEARMAATFDEPPDGLGTALGARLELLHAARVEEAIADRDLDLVHDHSFAGPLLARARDVPTVVTAHGPIDDATAALYASVPDLSVVAISASQRRSRPGVPWIATVPNAVHVDGYPFRERKDGFLLFLGRIDPTKGVDTAIEVARAACAPLVIAAKCTEPSEERFFEGAVAPHLGADVRYVGSADAEEKRDLLSAARALLCPIRWEEPFGLVTIEAMACGTPVVATPRGAFPEIVRDGVTGFLRSDVDGLADAARRVGELDPRACRDHVRASFDDAVMTARYEAVYASIAGGRRGAPDGPRADGSAASDGEAATADGSAAPARS